MKQLAVITFFVLMVNMANGQIEFGLQGGIGGATQSDFGNIYGNDNLFTGFNAGLIVRKPFSENFALKTNLMVALKGKSLDILQNGEYVDQTDKLSYLMLPVKAEYSIPVLKNRLFAAAGPYVGLLLDANQKIDGAKIDIEDEIEDFDFGLTFELGFSKVLIKNELQFSISYDMGLAKIVTNDEDLRNKALTFNVGYIF